MIRPKIWLITMALLGSGLGATSYEDTSRALVGEFWYQPDLFFQVDHELMSEQGYGSISNEVLTNLPPSDRALVEASTYIFEEARWVFGGIIYGWKFSYQPSDTLHQTVEKFELTPLAQIAVGDARLSVMDVKRHKSGLIKVTLRYHIDKSLQDRMNMRADANMLFSTGKGEMALQGGVDARRQALLASVKYGLRNYYQKHTHAKPRLISGYTYLEQPSIVAIKSGEFVAHSRLLFKTTEISHYAP
jgi:hypothetical protein